MTYVYIMEIKDRQGKTKIGHRTGTQGQVINEIQQEYSDYELKSLYLVPNSVAPDIEDTIKDIRKEINKAYGKFATENPEFYYAPAEKIDEIVSSNQNLQRII